MHSRHSRIHILSNANAAMGGMGGGGMPGGMGGGMPGGMGGGGGARGRRGKSKQQQVSHLSNRAVFPACRGPQFVVLL